MQTVGIECVNIPVKTLSYTKKGKEIERIKNSSDMVLAIDALVEAVESDRDRMQKVFILVAGDRDYIKLVTQIRNNYGQKIGIIGVPGSISGDLASAAEFSTPINITKRPAADRLTICASIIEMMRKNASMVSFWSAYLVEQWCLEDRNGIPGTAKEKRDALHYLLDGGGLKRREIEYKGKKVTACEMDDAALGQMGIK